jgi:hypothetical protein
LDNYIQSSNVPIDAGAATHCKNSFLHHFSTDFEQISAASNEKGFMCNGANRWQEIIISRMNG